MADRVSNRDGAALRMAEEGEFIQASGVDHGFEIVDPGFEGNVFDIPFREAIGAAVIANDALAVGQVAHPVAPDGTLPFKIEVVETVGDFDDGIAAADGGVGEADVICSAAEANFLAGRRIGFTGCGRRHGIRSVFCDGREEAITDAGDGLDKGPAAGLFAEGFAESGNVAIEVVVFDGGFGPDGGHQVLLRDEVSTGFHENAQGLEGLASDGDTSAQAEQEMLPEFQAKRAELIDDAGGFLTHCFRKIGEKNQP